MIYIITVPLHFRVGHDVSHLKYIYIYIYIPSICFSEISVIDQNIKKIKALIGLTVIEAKYWSC